MKKLAILFCLLLFGLNVSAQIMQVKSFERLPMDLTARVKPRTDLNGKYCAVVKIKSIEKDLRFSGNIIGEPEYKEGEIWLYFVAGSNSLTITDNHAGIIRYVFPDKVEEQVVYELDLRFVENKRERLRSIISVGFDFMALKGGEPENDVSFNIMVGIVRKFGGYARVRTNFYNGETPLGSIKGHNFKTNGYYISNERLAIIGGGLYRLSNNLYLMAGLGYGYTNAISDIIHLDTKGDPVSEVLKLSDYSSSGLEAEIGGVIRIVNIALSVNAQTNMFKYYEFGFGLGFMF